MFTKHAVDASPVIDFWRRGTKSTMYKRVENFLPALLFFLRNSSNSRTHALSMSRLKFVIKPVSCDGSLQSIVMCWPCASSILSQAARSTNWKRDVRTVSAPGSYTRSVKNAMLCSFVSG